MGKLVDFSGFVETEWYSIGQSMRKSEFIFYEVEVEVDEVYERMVVSFFIDNWWLIFMALTSGGLLLFPRLLPGQVDGLNPTEMVQLMNRSKGVVIDVSSQEEWDQSHIKNAKHIPLDQIKERLTQVIKNKDLPLILVCAKGRRSAQAISIAKTLGFTQVHALAGGLTAWKNAQMPTESTKKIE